MSLKYEPSAEPLQIQYKGRRLTLNPRTLESKPYTALLPFPPCRLLVLYRTLLAHASPRICLRCRAKGGQPERL